MDASFLTQIVCYTRGGGKCGCGVTHQRLLKYGDAERFWDDNMLAEGGIRIGRNVRVPASALTLNGFRRWIHSSRAPKRGRFSFIAGELRVEMGPEDINTHTDAKRDLTIALTLETRQRDLGRVFMDGVLLVNEEADLSTEPDLMFCTWETLETGRAVVAEAAPGSGRFVELQGSPDLVVEIVSRSSVTKDNRDLRGCYFLAGVREYWVVDARRAEVSLRVLNAGQDDYLDAAIDADGFQRSVVLERSIKLTRVVNRAAGFDYSLWLK